MTTTTTGTPAARYWAALLTFTQELASQPEPVLSDPQVRAWHLGILSEVGLATMPGGSARTAAEEGLMSPRPATVERALAFIDQRAAEPLTVAEVAAAAGVGVRALQHAFELYAGATPMEHLRRVRLDHAHDELLTAGATSRTSIADVAHRWGFASASRFSASYRERYGCLPSETLRRR
ncbi:helix-turn-helix domain-containing protein [Nocardioides stalactiti]|uniref:helix-turn-helix domain-containing protein n=1 Tax=Nocardioides stalactiti TaxID=2755356 RepID=UPI0016028EF8|nr:helix-turn-helix domain-containing protein [Nocardioides stalactiti]